MPGQTPDRPCQTQHRTEAPAGAAAETGRGSGAGARSGPAFSPCLRKAATPAPLVATCVLGSAGLPSPESLLRTRGTRRKPIAQDISPGNLACRCRCG
eukprot:288253-Alexandrium_andersonii.AAC.1